ncbi:MAG TPA: DUF3037 domain-containing protein [Terriglobales bacterium]|nr:DUF3037 domain-containing protein [Terriglobales bacterium]
MPARQQCNFFLLRYVPDAVKNEFVNVGLVLLAENSAPEVRFNHDWSRVQCLDSQADIPVLESLEGELRERLRTSEDRNAMLKRIQDSFSNAIQPSEPKACLAESPAKEADELARLYLERPRRRGTRELSPRQMIRQSMQDEFERVGVWGLLRRDIRAADYTRNGDPLKIDCGYSPNGTVKLCHAVALSTDVNAAKVLAFTFPQLAEGIHRAEHKRTELTAVVEDDLDRADESINFAWETMEQERIRVMPLAGMRQYAETAAREMKV